MCKFTPHLSHGEFFIWLVIGSTVRGHSGTLGRLRKCDKEVSRNTDTIDIQINNVMREISIHRKESQPSKRVKLSKKMRNFGVEINS